MSGYRWNTRIFKPIIKCLYNFTVNSTPGNSNPGIKKGDSGKKPENKFGEVNLVDPDIASKLT